MSQAYTSAAQTIIPPGAGISTINHILPDGTGNFTIGGGQNIAITPGVNGIAIGFTGILPIANGGTNASAYSTPFGTLYYNGANFNTTATGTLGQALLSNGPGVAPSYQNISAAGAVTSVTAGENINNSGTALNPILNLDRAIRLPETNAAGTEGVIYLSATCAGNECTGGQRFMHNYGGDAASNAFFGRSAGNFTLTVGTATNNLGIGSSTLLGLTVGSFNVACGGGALFQNNSGASNSAFGYHSLFANQSGGGNVAAGENALRQLVSGTFNVGIGYHAGENLTGADSSNVYINNSGGTGESNTLRIGVTTGTGNLQLNRAFINGINGITNTAASSVVLIDTAGQLATNPGGAVTLNTGTQAINISTDAANTTVNIAFGSGNKLLTLGSTVGASATTLLAGTGNMRIDGVGATLMTIGNSLTTGTINIGGGGQTGLIALGNSGAAQDIFIGAGNTGVKTIHIGDFPTANIITIGTGGTGTTTLGNLTGTTRINFGGGSALQNYQAAVAWTPVLRFNSLTTGITYATQQGQYTRIGSLVIFSLQITLTNKGTATGAATIIGLPINPIMNIALPAVYYAEVTYATGSPIVLLGGDGVFNIYSQSSANASPLILTNTAFTNNTTMIISGSYLVP